MVPNLNSIVPLEKYQEEALYLLDRVFAEFTEPCSTCETAATAHAQNTAQTSQTLGHVLEQEPQLDSSALFISYDVARLLLSHFAHRSFVGEISDTADVPDSRIAPALGHNYEEALKFSGKFLDWFYSFIPTGTELSPKTLHHMLGVTRPEGLVDVTAEMGEGNVVFHARFMDAYMVEDQDLAAEVFTEMLMYNLPLVVKEMRMFHTRYRIWEMTGQNFAPFLQENLLFGLPVFLRAVKGYDPERGPFGSFYSICARSILKRYLSHTIPTGGISGGYGTTDALAYETVARAGTDYRLQLVRSAARPLSVAPTDPFFWERSSYVHKNGSAGLYDRDTERDALRDSELDVVLGYLSSYARSRLAVLPKDPGRIRSRAINVGLFTAYMLAVQLDIELVNNEVARLMYEAGYFDYIYTKSAISFRMRGEREKFVQLLADLSETGF